MTKVMTIIQVMEQMASASDQASASNAQNEQAAPISMQNEQASANTEQNKQVLAAATDLEAPMGRLSAADNDAPVFKSHLDPSDSLLRVLQCPVCTEYMMPPIGLCAGGHSQCSKCRPKQENCPLCHADFLTARNLQLETIAQSLEYPCHNYNAGCTEKYPLDLINQHQELCPRRIYKCMLGGGEPCDWTGRRTQLLQHAQEAHTLQTYSESEITQVLEDVYTVHADMVNVLGEVFVLHRQYDPFREQLCLGVQFIGPSDHATRYKYVVDFTAETGLPSVKFQNMVHPDHISLDDIFTSGKCVRLGYDSVLHFMRESLLHFTVTVIPI